MTSVPLVWLNRTAIDMFIKSGSMDPYEKDCHEDGEKKLLDVIKRILEDRNSERLVPVTPSPPVVDTQTSRVKSRRSGSSPRMTSSLNTASTHDEDRDGFIVDLDKLMIKESSLDLLSHSDRRIFEFLMLDNGGTEKSYVGKRFTLVRRRIGEIEEDRKRNINDVYNRVSRELHVWNKLRNLDNFVQLLYISLDDGKSITAVSESFHRDVRQCFPKVGTTEIDLNFVIIMKGVAEALDFLHKFSDDIPDDGNGSPSELQIKKIAHSDVKCANVFLKEGSSIPYLADFGVSHQVVEGAFTKMIVTSGANAIGTAPWMPPELLILPENAAKVLASNSDGKPTRTITYTTESDVWSFGMTIYEIVSWNDPWNNLTKACSSLEDVSEKIKEAMRRKDLPDWPPLIPDHLRKYSNELKKLHKRCCKYNHKDRLKMEDVVKELNKIFGQ